MLHCIMMETVSFKLKKEIIKDIDQLIKPMRFNNRTEFIRQAIREKLNNIETELFLRKIKKFKGAAKTKTSDKKIHRIREEIGKKYLGIID